MWWRCLLLGLLPLVAGAQRRVDVILQPAGLVDICSDREAVIIIRLSSPLYISDSLLLFQFNVGYNPSKLQFIAPLFSGTVAETADYQGSGAVDSSVVRVWAFNVTRPFSGNEPLCGLLFRYRPECQDTAVVQLATEPEVNAEAKLIFGELGKATLQAVEQPNPNRSLTAQFLSDTTFRAPVSQVVTIPVRFTIGAGARLRRWRWRWMSQGPLQLQQVQLVSSDSLQLQVDTLAPQFASVTVSSPGRVAGREVLIYCSAMLKEQGPDTVRVEVDSVQCGCVTFWSGDTLVVAPEVGGTVEEPEQEDEFWWSPTANGWELRGPVDCVDRCVTYDITGRILSSVAPAERFVVQQRDAGATIVGLWLRNGTVRYTMFLYNTPVWSQ